MKESQFLTFEGQLPKGLAYIDWIYSKDQLKERLTLEQFKKDTEEHSLVTYQSIGDMLGMFYRLSVCAYGCRGGDHQIEYMIGKAYNTGVAALKLLRLGFYDESLGLIRSLSEIANLLCLFKISPDAYDIWRAAGERERIRDFGPGKIRSKIVELNAEPPISQAYYAKLCEIGVHVTPKTRPSGYNEHELALVGGFVIPFAPIAVINDLSFNLFYCILMGASCVLPIDRFMDLTDELKEHLGKMGELSIINLEEFIKERKEKGKTP
jgi:hypothetical protein